MSNEPTDFIVAIDAALEVVNPLEGLVERTATNPGAPFETEVLTRLCELKRENKPAFEVLRAELKAGEGCRVTALDEAMAQMSGTDGGRGSSQADILISLTCDLFLLHTSDGIGFVDLEINGHRETWPIRSKAFKQWLARQYYEQEAGAPNSEALQSTLNVVEAGARFDAQQMDVHIRVAGSEGKLYLDLTDDRWRAIEIDEDGWRIVDEPPIRFRRAAGMKPLPTPVAGGSIELLRPFLNVSSDRDFVLIVAWILAALRDRGPYPVLVLSGEQGSAKSTFSAILRALLDPNAAPLRALPREDRDLFIAATNGHVLAFDNVSGLRDWISDTLCRLATGGGFAVRQLFTDQDEVLFEASRPVILNGIEEIVARPDLADRAIFLTLEPIPEERRRSEKELWTKFDEAAPQILGALLDAVSLGIRKLPDVTLKTLPRMADFAMWATACEGVHSDEGAFMRAYTGNRDEAIDSVIEADPVASAVRLLMETRAEWTGTASDLLDVLSEQLTETARRAKTWPATARALSGRLVRGASSLRKIGIDISKTKEGRARTRTIRISRAPEHGVLEAPLPSAASADSEKTLRDNGSGTKSVRTETQPADANLGDREPATVRENLNKFKETDGADGADAEFLSDFACSDDYVEIL